MIRKAIIIVLSILSLASFLLCLDRVSQRNQPRIPFGGLVETPATEAYVDDRLMFHFARYSPLDEPDRAKWPGGVFPAPVVNSYWIASWGSFTGPVTHSFQEGVKVPEESGYYVGYTTEMGPQGLPVNKSFLARNMKVFSIHVKLWPIMLLFPIYPTLAFVRGPVRRYRRLKKGLCLTCGYNLTGNTTGTCPECGEKT